MEKKIEGQNRNIFTCLTHTATPWTFRFPSLIYGMPEKSDQTKEIMIVFGKEIYSQLPDCDKNKVIKSDQLQVYLKTVAELKMPISNETANDQHNFLGTIGNNW